MITITPNRIETMIYIIRSQKVMLDSDLAKLYGVETKVLNQAVKRNYKRFPKDFMFNLNKHEYENLKSQFVTSSLGYGGRRKLPNVFTENGIAMLSSVLNSEKAIQMNITIMRVFVKLKLLLSPNESFADRIGLLEKDTNNLFRIIFKRLDILERKTPSLPIHRRKIGFSTHQRKKN